MASLQQPLTTPLCLLLVSALLICFASVITAAHPSSGPSPFRRSPPSPRDFVPSPPPPAPHPFTLNVYDFGAIGDEMSDDTAAFQAALDAAGARGGGTVVVPPGKFLFKGSLVMPNRCGALCCRQLLTRDSSLVPTSLARLLLCLRTQAVGHAPQMALVQRCCPLPVTATAQPPLSSLSLRTVPLEAFLFTIRSSPAAMTTLFPILGASTSSPTTLRCRISKSSTPSTLCARCLLVHRYSRTHIFAVAGGSAARVSHSFPLTCRSPLHRPHPRTAAQHWPIHRQHVRHRQSRKRSLEPLVLHTRALHALAAHTRPSLRGRPLRLGVLLQHLRLWIQHRVPFHRVGRWRVQWKFSRHRCGARSDLCSSPPLSFFVAF
jgi:hypothetical protein